MIWLVLAAAVGYTAAAVFSGLLHWDRALFVLPYTIMAVSFVLAYIKWGRHDLGDIFRRHTIRGLLGGIVIGLILARGVMTQPASTRPEGGHLLSALVWLGIVYGAVDAMLLNVIPVVLVYQSMGAKADRSRAHRTLGLVALAASLFVTAAYHLGYAEFQGPALVQPLIGNSVVTVGYLLTGSPVSALLAHIIMHVTAVLHGAETTFQLPPHY